MLIKTGNKFIDLAAAATAEIIPGANGAIGLKCRDSAGREIGTLGGAQSLDVERLAAPIVASSGTPSLAVFVQVEQTEHRPSADDVQAQTAAVVAYRITRSGAEPVFLGPEPSGVMFLGLAGGKLLDAATGCLHDGVDGAKQAVLHAAQAAWDSEHPGEPELNPAIVEQRVEPIKLVGGRRHAR